VVAIDAKAWDLGIRRGMAASTAQAMVPGLDLRDADPKGDAEGLERLALWALRRYSPIVAGDPPDGLVIDTTGADHLKGGEQRLLQDLLQRCEAAGLRASAAIADSWGAAHALARYSADALTVVPPGQIRKALKPLPVAGLRIAAETVEGLRVLGFERIGDLLATPRAPLTLRFGLELWRRIDQALGDIAEPIDPIRPPELIEVAQALGEPIAAAETIARSIASLVTKACALLEGKGQGARSLDLLCHRVDNRVEAVRIGTAVPNRDAKRLIRLLSDKIETIDPGFGIELMTLRVTKAEALPARQEQSALGQAPEVDVSSLVDVLTNRIGEAHLYRLAPVPSDVPERSVKRIAPASAATGKNWPSHWPRPSRLLQHPEAIDCVALLPDHPPVTFTWRGIRRRVKRADGPERVFGEWWKRDAELATVRDYFQVEDDAGERYWIYRAGDGADQATGSMGWFIHGVFG
jgi:protein ImuB